MSLVIRHKHACDDGENAHIRFWRSWRQFIIGYKHSLESVYLVGPVPLSSGVSPLEDSNKQKHPEAEESATSQLCVRLRSSGWVWMLPGEVDPPHSHCQWTQAPISNSKVCFHRRMILSFIFTGLHLQHYQNKSLLYLGCSQCYSVAFVGALFNDSTTSWLQHWRWGQVLNKTYG